MKNINKLRGQIILFIFLGLIASVFFGAIIASILLSSNGTQNMNPIIAWILGFVISFSFCFFFFGREKIKEIKSNMERFRDKV